MSRVSAQDVNQGKGELRSIVRRSPTRLRLAGDPDRGGAQSPGPRRAGQGSTPCQPTRGRPWRALTGRAAGAGPGAGRLLDRRMGVMRLPVGGVSPAVPLALASLRANRRRSREGCPDQPPHVEAVEGQGRRGSARAPGRLRLAGLAPGAPAGSNDELPNCVTGRVKHGLPPVQQVPRAPLCSQQLRPAAAAPGRHSGVGEMGGGRPLVLRDGVVVQASLTRPAPGAALPTAPLLRSATRARAGLPRPRGGPRAARRAADRPRRGRAAARSPAGRWR